jgi:hypothetical protein
MHAGGAITALHSTGLGPLEQLDVPEPDLKAKESIEGVLVDPGLHVTVITQTIIHGSGEIGRLELDGGTWSRHTFDDRVSQATEEVAVGRDGNAALMWKSAGSFVVAARIAGEWTFESLNRDYRGCDGSFVSCGRVDIADDNEVVATHVRVRADGSTAGALLRRDPITGAWSRPDVFRHRLTPPRATWSLTIGGGGDAILFGPAGDARMYQCAPATECNGFKTFWPAPLPTYADTTDNDIVMVYDTEQSVYASLHDG